MPPSADITVCIATHRRPAGLRRLLESICGQVSEARFDVVVVDNDAAQSARPVVGEFMSRLALTYLSEPTRGLARVRNRAVAAARGRYVAFIDDDEWATPHWLQQNYRVARETNADVVVGPVRPVFADDVPASVRGCKLFRESAGRDGEIIPWFAARTGNALVRATALPSREQPFATYFDFSGGEDVDLFWRMVEAGSKIVASSDALVFEERPASRASFWWVMRRALRNGTTVADVDWRHLGRRTRLKRGIKAALRGLGQAAGAGLLWSTDATKRLDTLIEAMTGFGKLARVLGLRIEEYRTHS